MILLRKRAALHPICESSNNPPFNYNRPPNQGTTIHQGQIQNSKLKIKSDACLEILSKRKNSYQTILSFLFDMMKSIVMNIDLFNYIHVKHCSLVSIGFSMIFHSFFLGLGSACSVRLPLFLAALAALYLPLVRITFRNQ